MRQKASGSFSSTARLHHFIMMYAEIFGGKKIPSKHIWRKVKLQFFTDIFCHTVQWWLSCSWMILDHLLMIQHHSFCKHPVVRGCGRLHPRPPYTLCTVDRGLDSFDCKHCTTVLKLWNLEKICGWSFQTVISSVQQPALKYRFSILLFEWYLSLNYLVLSFADLF